MEIGPKLAETIQVIFFFTCVTICTLVGTITWYRLSQPRNRDEMQYEEEDVDERH